MSVSSQLAADRKGNRAIEEALKSAPIAAGTTTAAVRWLERMLKQAGFAPGKIDSNFDAATTKELLAFQAAWGLPATGAVDAKTFKALRAVQARVRRHEKKCRQEPGCPDCSKIRKKVPAVWGVGQKHGNIGVAEKRLKALGYKVGAVDGVYDRQTAQAVRAFRKDQKDPPDNRDRINGEVIASLQNELGDLQHVAYRQRVRPKKGRKALDARTAQFAKRMGKDGMEGFTEGARGQHVKNVQTRLRAAGYDPKRSDGVMDERTVGALRAFQRKNKLPENGRVDAHTWRELSKSWLYSAKDGAPQQGLNERSAAVLRSERMLKKLGFKPGKVDGLFDQQTLRASRAFERKHKGNGTDGRIGSGQIRAMQREVADRAGQVVTAYRNGRPFKLRVQDVGGGELLATKAVKPYKQLLAAAKKAGFNLYGYSGFRSMAKQVELYNLWKARRGNPADPPGWSKHQAGISMDIGGINGYGTRAYAWMKANAPKFGFFNNARPPEFWHWSYLR